MENQTELRAIWQKAKSRLELVEAKRTAVVRRFNKEYYAALKAEAVAMDKLPEFIGNCENCAKAIFEGDKHWECDGWVECEEHAPMLSDIILSHKETLSAYSESEWAKSETADYFTRAEIIDKVSEWEREIAATGDYKILKVVA